jgi:negative regulator of replication initiation
MNRYEVTRRVLTVYAIVARAGVAGVTSERVRDLLEQEGFTVAIRTVQRDLSELVSNFRLNVESVEGEHNGRGRLYFVDRTKKAPPVPAPCMEARHA